MLGKCFLILCVISVIFGILTGQLGAVSGAIPDGAERAVELVISLSGMMALWNGLLSVLQRAGAIRVLAGVLSPLCRAVFPSAWESGVAKEEITAAISANLLGIGNAATPLALSAMEKMQKNNPHPDTATEDMITFTVLATCPLSLFPSTLVALRRAAGSGAPERILVPVWLTSAILSVTVVVLARLLARTGRVRHDP